jgi:lipopolysaccharide/colanic/teichoic acid biosynthesis glycosyltransferase
VTPGAPQRAAAAVQELSESKGTREIVRRVASTLDDVVEGRLTTHADDNSPKSAPQGIGKYSRAGEVIKDVLDRVLAVIGLVVVSPVLIATAIAVRLDSPGPAFFRQTRVGRGGRAFHFWKFRGMYVDARERFPELYDYRYTQEQVQELRFHPGEDPRVTRVGRFIRRTSLDELPNLVNVVLGDMSLVGPRPEIPELLPYYGDSAHTVLSVKPGITSVAKLLGRDHFTFRETLELDVRYVSERSLKLDAAVIMGTVWLVLTGRSVGW